MIITYAIILVKLKQSEPSYEYATGLANEQFRIVGTLLNETMFMRDAMFGRFFIHPNNHSSSWKSERLISIVISITFTFVFGRLFFGTHTCYDIMLLNQATRIICKLFVMYHEKLTEIVCKIIWSVSWQRELYILWLFFFL